MDELSPHRGCPEPGPRAPSAACGRPLIRAHDGRVQRKFGDCSDRPQGCVKQQVAYARQGPACEPLREVLVLAVGIRRVRRRMPERIMGSAVFYRRRSTLLRMTPTSEPALAAPAHPTVCARSAGSADTPPPDPMRWNGAQPTYRVRIFFRLVAQTHDHFYNW